ncbi:MAG: thiamine pyrophosphate-requiring protein [Burkholderiales bacterium]|nr:thiamine pyrophosphate-requiring protein [Burkholderiales bacterium]
MHGTAHYLLDALQEHGVELLFCNLGTDHAPLIEEIARRRAEGRPTPRTVLVPHENVAVHMAAGYAIATGRGQAVLVHVDVGTANAAMALHNLARMRVPVLLLAGRAPFTSHGELPGTRDTYVHYIQEPFDQGSLVRPYVKWEYTLPSGVVAKEVLDRACSVMHSDPRGPAYLMLPREVLAQEWASEQVRSPLSRPVLAQDVADDALDEIADRLLAAESPLLVTSYAGRRVEAVAAIDALARFAGVRVCEFNPLYLNIPRASPCFAGWQPAPWVADADVGLMVDVDVPWLQNEATARAGAYWAQIDVDAVKRDLPLWSFPADRRIEGDSAAVLARLLRLVRQRATPEFLKRAAARMEMLGAEHAQRTRRLAALAREPGTHGRINPHHLCAAVARRLRGDDIVLNEAVRNAPAVFAQIPDLRPGSLVGLAGGGLGFSAGTALGLKLARPRATVVQFVGDGSFYFCNPDAALAVSQRYGLPVLTIVLDNAGWSAVKEATLRMYPDGFARRQDLFQSAFVPDVDFAAMARGAGAHGERLVDPNDIEAALDRAFDALRIEGRGAVLQVALGPH